MTLNPALFTTNAADGTDTTKLRPSNWNRVVAILNAILDGADATGGILLRDASDAVDGSTWLPAVAAGSVLVSSGVGVAPAWSASPTLTKVLAGDGTVGAPAFAFSSESTTGLYKVGAGVLGLVTGGGLRLNINGNNISIPANGAYNFSSVNNDASGAIDTTLSRNAAGKITLTGTTPMLQLGGTTSSFPALKRNAAVLEARLADDSAYAALTAGLVTANTGGLFGYSNTVATTSAGPRVGNTWIPRIADLSGNIWLDYQDEYAFIDGRGATVSTTPASTSGATSDLFHDDSNSLNWAAGVTGGQVQITIDHTATAAVVPNRNNGSYQIGLTFRSDFIGPGHIKLEAWNTASGGSFSTVYDADVTIFNGAFGCWVSPTFVSPDASFNMYKTRITLSQLPDPTTGNFRVQRVALYHSTAPWDSFHLGVGGGTLYGALSFAGTAGADTTISRTAVGKLQLSGGTNPQLLFGGTTSSFPALKRTSANVEVRTADDASYSGIVVDLLAFGPARGAIRQGGADGVFTLFNNALTDFGRLQFGGTTASFPSLKRDTVFLQLRLADDSGVCGAATASLPAAASARDGIIGFDTTLNALVYYVGGSRFKLAGTSF